MDDGMDYNVQTKVTFRLDFDGSGEFNMLLLPDIQKQFAKHVKEVYAQDDTLGNGYISSDLNFHFDGRKVQLEYTFSCCDENEAEAESFSDYCVRGVQKKLEAFGCKNLFSIYTAAPQCDIIAEQEGVDADEKKLSE